jgi:gamma-glutamyl-gamma-aminobutyrate hydrolase PuuD
MNSKPIIGVIGKVQPKYEDDLWHRIDEVDEIRYLIVKNGGIPIVLLPTEKTLVFNDNDIKDEKMLNGEEICDLKKQIDLCDGFILQGGLFSCNYEIEIAKMVLEQDKPLLGICAGFNNILRALGTDVVEDKSNSHNYYDINYRHKINIDVDSQLYNIVGQKNIEVNSIHSMIAPKEMVNSYAKISSYSEDGLVESFEVPNKRFVMGIKWHPELMLNEKYVDKLFNTLINKC